MRNRMRHGDCLAGTDRLTGNGSKLQLMECSVPKFIKPTIGGSRPLRVITRAVITASLVGLTAITGMALLDAPPARAEQLAPNTPLIDRGQIVGGATKQVRDV